MKKYTRHKHIKVFLTTLLLLSLGLIGFQVPQSASEKGYEPTLYVIDMLFDSPKIESDDESGFVWVPDSEEEAIFNISYDGLCHTRLDTILNFEDILIYVFKTQTYDKTGNIVGCHFFPANNSVAVLRNIPDLPEVIYSRKHLTDSGLFGGEGKEGVGVFSVVKIERNAYLSLKRPVAGNNGFNVGMCDLYLIDNDLPHAFSYEYYSEANGKTIKRNLNLGKSSRSRIVTNSSDGVETWHSVIDSLQNKNHCVVIETTIEGPDDKSIPPFPYPQNARDLAGIKQTVTFKESGYAIKSETGFDLYHVLSQNATTNNQTGWDEVNSAIESIYILEGSTDDLYLVCFIMAYDDEDSICCLGADALYDTGGNLLYFKLLSKDAIYEESDSDKLFDNYGIPNGAMDNPQYLGRYKMLNVFNRSQTI